MTIDVYTGRKVTVISRIMLAVIASSPKKRLVIIMTIIMMIILGIKSMTFFNMYM